VEQLIPVRDVDYVRDAAGKRLTNAQTNTAVELFPGQYAVDLNGATLSLAVRAGEQTTLRAK